jgi:glycosidase
MPTTPVETVYQEHGFATRDLYLLDLFEAHGVPSYEGYLLADLLGPEEDFDGLVTALIEYEGEEEGHE